MYGAAMLVSPFKNANMAAKTGQSLAIHISTPVDFGFATNHTVLKVIYEYFPQH